MHSVRLLHTLIHETNQMDLGKHLLVMRRVIDNKRTATRLSQEEPKPASAAVSASVNFLICLESAVPLPSTVAMDWLGSSLSSSHSILEQSHWSVSPSLLCLSPHKSQRSWKATAGTWCSVSLSERHNRLKVTRPASRASKSLSYRQTVTLNARPQQHNLPQAESVANQKQEDVLFP